MIALLEIKVGGIVLVIVSLVAVGLASGTAMRLGQRDRLGSVVGVIALACGSVLFLESFGVVGIAFPLALVAAALAPLVLGSGPTGAERPVV